MALITKQQTGPSKDPITVNEAKEVIGLTEDQQQFDGLIKTLIVAATKHFENNTNRKLMQQTWRAFFPDWPEYDYIEIPYPPLQSITHVKYEKSDGSQETWDSSNYTVQTNIEPGRVTLAYQQSFPTATLEDHAEVIEVEFVCGYADQGAVPYDIKVALQLLVDFWFTNRGEMGGSKSAPASVEALIDAYRVHYI